MPPDAGVTSAGVWAFACAGVRVTAGGTSDGAGAAGAAEIIAGESGAADAYDGITGAAADVAPDAAAGMAGGGKSTGTNFGCVADAGIDTYDGSGGTALAGIARAGPRSVTPGSSGAFPSPFF